MSGIKKRNNFKPSRSEVIDYTKTTLAVLGGSLVVNYFYTTVKSLLSSFYLNVILRRKLDKQGKECKARQIAKIKAFVTKYKDSISNEKIEEIINYSADDLSLKIKKKEITSRDACLAYSIRLATIGFELNLITDVRFEDALNDADKADEIIANASSIDELPEYIGFPITIKETYFFKGMNNTLGLQKFANQITDKNCHLVDKLIQLGAIALCLTINPQSNLAFESGNNIYGKAQNPWNRSKTTGGSSGGCCGLTAAYCTPLSWGGDIGGSIRQPAGFCGVYGFKPSSHKFSSYMTFKTSGLRHTGWKPFEVSQGPLARKLSDIISVSKTMFGTFEKERSIPNKKFDEEAFNNGLVSSYDNKKKIKIAFNYDNDLAETMQEIKTCLKRIETFFSEQGYEVTTIDLTSKLRNLFENGISQFGAVFTNLNLIFGGEKPKYYYQRSLFACQTNSVYYYFYRLYLKLKGENRIIHNMDAMRQGRNIAKHTSSYLASLTKLDIYRQEFFDYIREQEIDCIIAPIFPTTAFDLDKTDYAFVVPHYTVIQNILNLPGGTIPLKLCEDTTYNSKYEDYITKKLKENCSTSKGMPVSIQVNTLPYQDERCLRIMQEVDKVFKYSENKEIQDTIKSKVNSYVENK